MTTLHRVTEATKKIGIGFTIGILCIIFLILSFRLFVTVKESIFPTPLAPPTVTFGKLPKIVFPPTTSQPLTVSLNTVSGSLPTLDDRVIVYKLQLPQVSFSSIDKAKTIAATNNFLGDPTPISDTIYQWNNTNPTQSFTLNIQTFDFSFTSAYLSYPIVLSGTNLGNPSDAIVATTNYFTNYHGSLPSDIDTSKTQTSLFAIQNNLLVPASSLSDAQVIRVDFYQSDINKLPLYYPHYPASLISAFVASGDSAQEVVGATFVHKTVNPDSNATYPTKTAQEGYDELKKGEAFIANYDTPDKPVVIRKVSLGYYISDDPGQEYLMPIIVFQGDHNFYAYVSAIKNEWIRN